MARKLDGGQERERRPGLAEMPLDARDLPSLASTPAVQASRAPGGPLENLQENRWFLQFSDTKTAKTNGFLPFSEKMDFSTAPDGLFWVSDWPLLGGLGV